MQTLTFQLGNAGTMCVGDASLESSFFLAELAELTGGSLAEQGTPDVVIADRAGKTAKGCFLVRSDFQVRTAQISPRFTVESPPVVTDRAKCDIWQTAMLFGWAARELQGAPVLPIHGALLEMDDGTGVLLCAASGVGKSTTARRWRQAGKICRADDMILLDFSRKELVAHPLPTWSSCRETLAGKFYPVEAVIPVKKVLVLDRARGKEEIQAISSLQMASTLYFACTMFEQEFLLRLPESDQKILSDHAKAVAAELNRAFPPRALYAHLDGDLTALRF